MVSVKQRLYDWMFARLDLAVHITTHAAPMLKACVLLPLLLSTLVSDAAAQYSGPSILSRGGNKPGQRGRAPVDFALYASVRGTYETGLIPVQLDESGEITAVDAAGGLVEAGLYGGHNWRRTQIGVDYRGDYRYNNKRTTFNGTNQALALQLEHQISRHVTLSVSQTGGTTNRAFGAFSAPAFGDTNRLGIPLNELFDTRMYYLQTNATVTWQRSARMALTGGGDGFFVKRQSLSLINGQGFRTIGGVAYRVSRRTTLTAGHQFLRFEFPRIYARSDLHAVHLGIQNRCSRNIEITALGGAYLSNSTGVESVTLSPEVAAILGRSTGAAAFRRRSVVPLVDLQVAYLQERGRFYVSANSSSTPGNGIMLTSRRNTLSVGYSYSGVRRMSLGVSAGYMQMHSIALNVQNSTAWQGGGAMSYRLRQGLDLTSHLDYRSYTFSEVRARKGFAFALGLSYTTSRFPISIW